jgi:ATP-dependent protease Clp ATPase subunit
MKENYYALLICILRPLTIEQSFNIMEGKVTKVQNKWIRKDDVEDMIRMKQYGMTYKAIGKLFGLKKDAVHKRIKRYKEV